MGVPELAAVPLTVALLAVWARARIGTARAARLERTIAYELTLLEAEAPGPG